MPARTVYVYRLNIKFPPGSDQPGWRPADYDTTWLPEDADLRVFSWPKRRLYLSASAAEKRAAMLRRWGCTVGIDRSAPVTFANVGPYLELLEVAGRFEQALQSTSLHPEQGDATAAAHAEFAAAIEAAAAHAAAAEGVFV